MISDCWNVSRRRKCRKCAFLRAREKNARRELPRRGDCYAIPVREQRQNVAFSFIWTYTGQLSRNFALSLMFSMAAIIHKQSSLLLRLSDSRKCFFGDNVYHQSTYSLGFVTEVLLYDVYRYEILIFSHYLSSLIAMIKILSYYEV